MTTRKIAIPGAVAYHQASGRNSRDSDIMRPHSGDGAGAEAISGLGRAFFYAGARALLVSNWPVETTSAKALTTEIFLKQADDPSLSRTQALRQAMLGLMDGPSYVDSAGQSVFSYAHPIFWAPFTLIGDGGHGSPGA